LFSSGVQEPKFFPSFSRRHAFSFSFAALANHEKEVGVVKWGIVSALAGVLSIFDNRVDRDRVRSAMSASYPDQKCRENIRRFDESSRSWIRMGVCRYGSRRLRYEGCRCFLKRKEQCVA
jgi:hypothetical protein